MLMTGTYNGSVIETPFHLQNNQRVIIIPINNDPGKSYQKQQIINSLFGCASDSGVTVDQLREERLSV